MSIIKIFNDDCRNISNYIETNSIQCIVTSPPFYGLRDYKINSSIWGGEAYCEHNFINSGYFKTFCEKCGAWQGGLGLEPNPDMYCEHIVNVFNILKKILKPDGVVFLNIGDCYYNGKVAGGCVEADKLDRNEDLWSNVKNADPKNKARRFGRRPIDCPIPGLKQKDLIGIPWRCALALQKAGWFLRDSIIWAKAIVDQDGVLSGSAMPSPSIDRCVPSYEYIFQLSQSKKYYFNLSESKTTTNSTMRNVWKIPTERKNINHYASFPVNLVERCIKLGTKETDYVLDPFCGSGTTGVACLNTNRNFVGFEISEEYFNISKNRLNSLNISYNEKS